MSDDGAITPRITALFQLWATASRELAADLLKLELLRSKNITCLDRDVADVARAYRLACLSYAKLFEGWPVSGRSTEQKNVERSAFERLRDSALIFIEEHK